MKTLLEFLEERSFADFLAKAQNRQKGPLDYALDAKNPIVYEVSNSVGAKQVHRAPRRMYFPLKTVAKGKDLKQALKSIDRTGFAVIDGKRYAVFTGDADMQMRVYDRGGRTTLEMKEVDDEISQISN